MASNQLKIGFQGWYLPQTYTGIGQHCRGLLIALAKEANRKNHNRKNTLEIIIPVPSRVRIKGIPQKWIRVLKPKWWIPIAGLKKWYWERAQAPAFFAKYNPDWEHYPYPCPLPQYSPNLRSVTVHDTILWNDKRYSGYGLSGRLKNHYHKLARRSLVQTDHIFTVSQATHEELGIPAATLLPNAITKIPTGLKRLSYENTLVYFGGYDIRKNVPKLVKAFASMRKLAAKENSKHTNMQLVLIGAPHHNSRYYPEIPEIEGVQMLGPLPEKELYSALKSAFAFVHFSDSEGFNIPLLQAMAVGTPAIVSDIPVNHEVSNDEALFIKTSPKSHSQNSQAKQLFAKVKSLKNKRTREKVIAAQKKAAHRYSWQKSAKAFLKALK